jgi:hypothetical protein
MSSQCFISRLRAHDSRSDLVMVDKCVLRKALEGSTVMSRIVGSEDRLLPKKALLLSGT